MALWQAAVVALQIMGLHPTWEKGGGMEIRELHYDVNALDGHGIGESL